MVEEKQDRLEGVEYFDRLAILANKHSEKRLSILKYNNLIKENFNYKEACSVMGWNMDLELFVKKITTGARRIKK